MRPAHRCCVKKSYVPAERARYETKTLIQVEAEVANKLPCTGGGSLNALGSEHLKSFSVQFDHIIIIRHPELFGRRTKVKLGIAAPVSEVQFANRLLLDWVVQHRCRVALN